MIDAALATRDIANTLAARGATALDGSVFRTTDADLVPIAFNLVGLSPDLVSGWSEPQIEFSGTDTFFAAGETTASSCGVTNITASLGTPSGLRGADLSPATPLAGAVNFLGLYGISFMTSAAPGTTPPPIGTTAKFHSISWFNVFGVKPAFTTQVVDAPPPAGAVNCATPPGSVPVERTSAITARFLLFGGGATENIGNSASGINTACGVRRTLVELVDGAGNSITPPGNCAWHTVTLFHIFWFPVTTTRAVIINATPGPRPPNLSANVTWSHGLATDARFRLRYYIDQPPGVTCTP